MPVPTDPFPDFQNGVTAVDADLVDPRFKKLYDTFDPAQIGIDSSNLAASLLALLMPTGAFLPIGMSSTPTGFLMCDGAAVSRVTYASLFALFGTTWGVGDGSTTFNVPDFRGRALVGVDGAAGRLSANDALGNSGGEETHTLTVAESASHAHGPSSGSTPSFTIAVGAAPGAFLQTAGSGYGITGNALTNAQGGGGTHNNMQPFAVVYWVVKT